MHQRRASRGNYRSALFRDDGAELAFLDCLGEACEKAAWEVHAWWKWFDGGPINGRGRPQFPDRLNDSFQSAPATQRSPPDS